MNLRLRPTSALTLLLVSVVCAAAFLWPFVTSSPEVLAHAHDAPLSGRKCSKPYSFRRR